MKATIKASDITIGIRVHQYIDTLWGVRSEWEVVTAIRTMPRDGLIEIELRKEQVLCHVLRASPDTTLEVRF